MIIEEASRGARAKNVTVKSTGCEFDPHSRKLIEKNRLYFIAHRQQK